jgi:Ca2+-binding EF-hand superfamily protein
VILSKDIVKNNEVFSNDQSLQIFDVFQSFIDAKTGLMNVEQLLGCAKTLGLPEKFPTIMNILKSISKESKALDFESFLTLLTEKLGNVQTQEGRRTIFDLIDKENKGKITFENLKELAKEVGHIISDDDLKEIVQYMSKHETVSREEFERYLSRKIERNY